MDDIKIDGKLKAITAKPNKDGDVMVTITIEAEFSRDAMRLMARAGQGFTVKFYPTQLDMSGADAAFRTGAEAAVR